MLAVVWQYKEVPPVGTQNPSPLLLIIAVSPAFDPPLIESDCNLAFGSPVIRSGWLFPADTKVAPAI